jgi:hypothetical protein
MFIIILKSFVNLLGDFPTYIFKGFHKPITQFLTLLFTLRFYRKKKNKIVKYRKDVLLLSSLKHEGFISKIGGISIGHHRLNESFRFGFNGNSTELGKIDLFAFTERNKSISTKFLTTLSIADFFTVDIELNFKLKFAFYRVYDSNGVQLAFYQEAITSNKNWGYELGLYYGGKKRAPKTLKFIVQ